MHGHATLLVGFSRPDRIRLEMPGPAGARFVLVTRGETLTAVFPHSRAFFLGQATAKTLFEITGVELSASGIMDLLVGRSPAEASGYRVEWGERLPRRVKCRLSDGTALDLKVARPDMGREIKEEAFVPPAHDGYRQVGAQEARDLWLGR